MLFIVVVVFVVILLIVDIFPIQRNIVQPISYNHKIHIEEAGLECVDSHIYVEKLASVTIPSIEICKGCQERGPISNSKEEIKLMEYIEKGNEVPLQKIYSVPDHVIFRIDGTW